MNKTLIALIIILIAPTLAAAQEKITAESRIAAVTVYPDRAAVTRRADVQLKKGEYRITIPGLPAETAEDSIRLSGQGTARVKIGSVEYKREYLEAVPKEEFEKLQDELQGLIDQDRALSDDLAVANKRREFYQAIQFHNAEVWSREVTIGKPTAEDWAKVVAFLVDGQKDASSEARSIEVRRRELKDRADALKKRIDEMKPAGQKVRLDVSAEVIAETDGGLELALDYIVMGASWSPMYEARADTDGGNVSVAYIGQVRQRTSEDWKGVSLSLSTAKPSVGAAPPELYPWYVGIIEPVYRADRAMGHAKAAPAPAGARMAEAEVAAGAPPAPAETMTAEAEAAGTSVLFKALTLQDVPADGTVKNVRLAEEQFKAGFEYYAVPRVAPYAYLRASMTDEKDYPLLAGPVGVFIGGDYLGKSVMPLTAPGEKVELALGVDEGIKVRRELVRKQEEDTGIISKTRRITYHFRITIESYKKAAQKITVRDLLPVSQQEEVVVKEIRIEPRPDERDEQGILKWKLELQPKEKRVVDIEFYVEFPRGKIISGI